MLITRTPLRISFAGGGTDFPDYYKKYGGTVLSTTIDKYIYVMVKKRFDDKIVAHYRGFEMVDRPEELKHELIREALKLTRIKRGIEISTTADIPSTGTGLGSSSALTVGLLNALYTYKGELPTKEQLAQESCRIEIEILKKPIGKQDQYATAFGRLNFIQFNWPGWPGELIFVNPLELKAHIKNRLKQNLLLFYTGISRESSEILAEQKQNIPKTNKILDEMKKIVRQMKLCLKRGYIDEFGSMLDSGWKLKKKLASGITNMQIDGFYQKALDAGALGGKITGAGGGGFLLLYCPSEKQDKVREVLKELQELSFSFTDFGSQVIFNIER